MSERSVRIIFNQGQLEVLKPNHPLPENTKGQPIIWHGTRIVADFDSITTLNEPVLIPTTSTTDTFSTYSPTHQTSLQDKVNSHPEPHASLALAIKETLDYGVTIHLGIKTRDGNYHTAYLVKQNGRSEWHEVEESRRDYTPQQQESFTDEYLALVQELYPVA